MFNPLSKTLQAMARITTRTRTRPTFISRGRGLVSPMSSKANYTYPRIGSDRVGSQGAESTEGRRCSPSVSTNRPQQWSPRQEERSQEQELEESNFERQHPDRFGTLDPRKDHQRLAAEYLPEDDDGFDRLEKRRSRRTLRYYDFLLTSTIHRGGPDKMRRAIELFERMQREDRIAPETYHYTLLFKGCADFGLTVKAFDLFRDQQKKKLWPTKAAITALFNCCAECPDREVGLEKARLMMDWVHEIGYVCNQIQFHSMIKAFGKLGDLRTALEIVNDMTRKGVSVNSDTYCMLLVGCVSDKESGFAQALRIMRQMKFQDMPFTVHAFNLLLRSARECSVGSPRNMATLFEEWTKLDSLKYSTKQRFLRNMTMKWLPLEASPISSFSKSTSPLLEKCLIGNNGDDRVGTVLQPVSADIGQNYGILDVSKETPNLLAPLNADVRKQLIGLNYEALENPWNRLLLIGGMEGVLLLMKRENIKPSISTITLLLDSIPPNNEAENKLMEKVKQLGIKSDTDFFNMVIKRRCLRNDMASAKSALTWMQRQGRLPDIVTFGVLALGCSKREVGLQLLQDIEYSGFKVNAEIMGALVRKACYAPDFFYLMELMNLMVKYNIRPAPRWLEFIELARTQTNNLLLRSEKGLSPKIPERYLSKEFQTGFNRFNMYFKQWLRKVSLEVPEDPQTQHEFEPSPNPKEKMVKFEIEMRRKIRKRYLEIEDSDQDDHQDVDSYESDMRYTGRVSRGQSPLDFMHKRSVK